ncbi:hypothetical protein BC939DRAFT_482046 [Gamsiella multidivaricata]|uniref:uncharacterized protein n=1 Tax=Gamsiella multidivaricata TaxID=101098 RepID=UPI0022211A9C|nr:uncharacterized protein BC939DRAFT_482046 [Gamsiella multidivaricata]KAI7816437.1 hypothetical protein BC939DRAFT_482046 [Gamsiella multidivaricata]
MLSLCPHFDRFHAVYDGSLARNRRQSVTFPDDPPHRRSLRLSTLEVPGRDDGDDREYSPESNESEADISEATDDLHSGSARKRRKLDVFESPVDVIEAPEGLKDVGIKAVDIYAKELEENRKDARRREQALEAKEQAVAEKMNTLAEKLLDIERNHYILLKKWAREQYASFVGRVELFEAEKSEFKQEKAEFKQEKAEFKQEKAEFKQEKAEFKQEKGEFNRLHLEHAVIKRELELVRVQLNS